LEREQRRSDSSEVLVARWIPVLEHTGAWKRGRSADEALSGFAAQMAAMAMDDRQTTTGPDVYYWRKFVGRVCGGSLKGIWTLPAYYILLSAYLSSHA